MADEKEMAFEKLMEKNPADAMKYVKEFKDTVFWKYWARKLDNRVTELMMMLINCEKETIDKIRGRIEMLAEVTAFPDVTINNLNVEIDLIKESAEVEEARQ